MCVCVLQGNSKVGAVLQRSAAQRLCAVGHRGGARPRSDPQHGLCGLPEEGGRHFKEVSPRRRGTRARFHQPLSNVLPYT